MFYCEKNHGDPYYEPTIMAMPLLHKILTFSNTVNLVSNHLYE